MVSTKQLEIFAKQAAVDYLKTGTSLQESITKIASDNALNKEQIARIAEAANTDVYMNLFNKTEDKYIQFPTADPNTIFSGLNEVKTAEAVVDESDYIDAPEYEAPEFTPIFEKTAEEPVIEKSNDETMRDYWRFKGAEAHMQGLLTEGQMMFEKESVVLREMIKQAVLGGTPYSDIHAALSTNNDPVFSEALKAIETQLSYNMPIGSLTKTASSLPHTVNAKHPLIQQSFKLTKIAQEYKIVSAKLEELNNDWKLYKSAGSAKNTVELVAGSPKAFGLGLIGGGAVTALAIPTIAKERAVQQASALNVVPQHYRG